MKTSLGVVSAALLLTGAAYVLPAHAQMAQPQPYGSYSTSAPTQPYGAPGWGQTQPYGTTGQMQPYGTTGQMQPYGTTGQTQPYTGAQSYGVTTPTQTYGANSGVQPYRGSNQAQGQLPQGAYLSNCKDARIDEGTLIAFCQRPDGDWHTTQLRVNQCLNANDVVNVKGDLACGMGTGYGSSRPPAPQRPY